MQRKAHSTNPSDWSLNPDQPEIIQACSLALALMRTASVATWREFCRAASSRQHPVRVRLTEVVITDDQIALLQRHQKVLHFLMMEPIQTLAVCPLCEQWVVILDVAPPRCQMSLGCSGKPIKVNAAVRS